MHLCGWEPVSSTKMDNILLHVQHWVGDFNSLLNLHSSFVDDIKKNDCDLASTRALIQLLWEWAEIYAGSFVIKESACCVLKSSVLKLMQRPERIYVNWSILIKCQSDKAIINVAFTLHLFAFQHILQYICVSAYNVVKRTICVTTRILFSMSYSSRILDHRNRLLNGRKLRKAVRGEKISVKWEGDKRKLCSNQMQYLTCNWLRNVLDISSRWSPWSQREGELFMAPGLLWHLDYCYLPFFLQGRFFFTVCSVLLVVASKCSLLPARLSETWACLFASCLPETEIMWKKVLNCLSRALPIHQGEDFLSEIMSRVLCCQLEPWTSLLDVMAMLTLQSQILHAFHPPQAVPSFLCPFTHLLK